MTDQRVEALNSELVLRYEQSDVGEVVFSAGDHDLKVVLHVEAAKGGRRPLTEDLSTVRLTAQEHEMGLPSKRGKQESDSDPRIPLRFSLRRLERPGI